jgi:hypothetical protein
MTPFIPGRRYRCRSDETVEILAIDPAGTYPTEPPSGARDPTIWPIVYRVLDGRWRGLTGRVMPDGGACRIAGRRVEHESDILPPADAPR